MNKIAPALYQVFQKLKKNIFSKSKVELGLATIYIHHISTHMHILI
jgi:thiamine phosphate synthase YjbQ (UPF0047 family)